MFSILNYLQYFLQKPYRFALKRSNRFIRGMYKFGVFRVIYDFIAYFALSPLRLLNAFWYDIIVYPGFCFKDAISDLFVPKNKKWIHRKWFGYAFFWLIGLPWRFLQMVFHSIGRFIEGVFFTFFDVFVPTLTMMHGTREDAAISISSPGKWIVGDGDYAGNGIYFTMNKSVAKHYADRANYSSKHPVIIYSRVSLGRNRNLMVLTDKIGKSLHQHDGDELTRWGRANRITSFEWWRKDPGWWEYCMLNQPKGCVVKTWRIRVLYIRDLADNRIERVNGGKAFWLGLF